MKKQFFFLLVLLLLFLSACQNETSPQTDLGTHLTTLEADASATFEALTSEIEIPPSSDIAVTTTVPPVTTSHVHNMKERSRRSSTCSAEGAVVFRCDCGEVRTEALPILSHTPTAATCLQGSSCSVCGAKISDPLGHHIVSRGCDRCDYEIKCPVFVLGLELDFDEKVESIRAKLGAPTETLYEGDMVSLVYASNLSTLTVIQTDGDGLWGVFTLDPEARLCLGEKTVTIANFSGADDVNSDAFYQDAGSCRIFGFRDGLNGGAYYGLWMRYSECRYDYIEDDRIFFDYYAQNRLNFYFTNALRARHGIAPLIWSKEAAEVAVEYSSYMLEMDFFDHDGSYGERLRQKGILWQYAGENISQGYFNSFFVTDAYYNSRDHRDNLLSPDFTHVGVGHCRKTDGATVFGAQIFYG
ncbi:MAG: CAP domain-containing protein [Clostridia bacterium]|nr:CAP domain-containing protein [Clostridia bacterium]